MSYKLLYLKCYPRGQGTSLRLQGQGLATSNGRNTGKWWHQRQGGYNTTVTFSIYHNYCI